MKLSSENLPIPPEEFLRRMADLFDSIPEEELTPEELDEELRSYGYDPEEIGQRIQALVERALAEVAKTLPR